MAALKWTRKAKGWYEAGPFRLALERYPGVIGEYRLSESEGLRLPWLTAPGSPIRIGAAWNTGLVWILRLNGEIRRRRITNSPWCESLADGKKLAESGR